MYNAVLGLSNDVLSFAGVGFVSIKEYLEIKLESGPGNLSALVALPIYGKLRIVG